MNHLRNVAFVAAFTAVLPFVHAEETVYWSETPVTCHWIGAERYNNTASSATPANGIPAAQWTNANNWAEGIVPGRFEVVREDGSIVTNGSLGCTAVFGDRSCTYRCVDYHGLVSISNIQVAGTYQSQFIFNRWQWAPSLPMECGGSFRVDSDVATAPYITTSYVKVVEPLRSGTVLTVENNSPTALSFSGWDICKSASAPWFGNAYMRLEGTGSVEKRSTTSYSGGYPCFEFAMSGGTFRPIAANDFANTLHGASSAYRQKIEIQAGKKYSVWSSPSVYTESDMDVYGDGVMELTVKNSSPQLAAAAGKTLSISVSMVRPSGSEYDAYGVTVGRASYPGVVRLSGVNTFASAVNVASGATLEVPSIGSAAAGGPLGTVGVTISGGSTLRYTGAGEVTDLSVSGTDDGTISIAGSGDLIWKGPISGGTSASFTVTNETEGAKLVFAGTSLSKAVTLAAGARLGFAKPDSADTISVDGLAVVGDSSIYVGDGVTVAVAAISRTAGMLDVILSGDGTGKFVLLNASEGPAADWITVNGSPSRHAADGSLYSLDSLANTRQIAAHGSVVPDAPGEAVGITSAGDPADGNDALASSLTRVRVLNQETAEPATVDVVAGQTLQVDRIRVKSGAGDLTIGSEIGAGAVSATDGTFEAIVDDPGTCISVNAALSVPASSPMRIAGAGHVVFPAWNGYAGSVSIEGGTMAFTNGNSLAATLAGTGKFDFSNGAMTLASSAADGIAAEIPVSSGASLGITGGKMTLAGGNTISASTVNVANGELVLHDVNIVAPGVSVDMPDTVAPAKTFYVASNGTAIVRFESGSVTGCLALANVSTDRGAIYQTGGEFANVTPYPESLTLGIAGYAYYGLYSGRFVAAGGWWLGNGGEGVLDITGGVFTNTASDVHRSLPHIGDWEAHAVVRVADDGVFDASASADAITMPFYNRYDTRVDFTVEGNGTVRMPSATNVRMACGYADSYCPANVNLNGGVFEAYALVRYASYIYPTEEWPEGLATSTRYTNSCAFVNCDGGTFRCLGYGSIFGQRSVSYHYPVNRVTLYGGGLVIDTNDRTCTLESGGGVHAPYGQGVASVPWNASTDGAGFVGSPAVRIVGDGSGASAWADFDYRTGTVTGIRVTSPGNGYTYANALVTMNRKVLKTIPCVLGTFASGGLVKAGSGMLTLNETNTYTGATTVKKGTLKLGYDDVISSASELVLDGGTLDMNNRSQTFSNIRATANGGSVINGTPLLSGLTVDFDGVLAGDVQTFGTSVAFAPGAKLTVANVGKAVRPPNRYVLAKFTGDVDAANLSVADATLENLPPRWRIAVEGKRVVLRYPTGTMLNFR